MHLRKRLIVKDGAALYEALDYVTLTGFLALHSSSMILV